MKNYTVDVFAICYNEEFMLPHFIKHYKDEFNANITIYDNRSTDKSKEIILAAGCNYIEYDSKNQIRDDIYLQIKNECWKKSKADWVIVCFIGKTMIETINGIKRIDKINVGELVKTHKGRYKKVLKIYKSPYPTRKCLIEINTAFNSIKSTPNHPYYTYINKQYQWVKAENITTKHNLLYPSKYSKDELFFGVKYNYGLNNTGKGDGSKKHGNFIDNINVDTDLAKLLGLYLAEGSASTNGIVFTINNEDVKTIDFICKTSNKLFNRNPIINKRWATQITINIAQFGPLFKKWFGAKATEKKIPNFIKQWNIKNKMSFMDGFITGDGNKSKNKNYYTGLSSSSLKLIEDILEILESCGIIRDKIIKKYISKERKIEHTYNNKKYSHQLKESINYRIKLSKFSFTKMKDILSSDWVDENYLAIKVLKVSKTKMAGLGTKNQYVYNLEVEDDHSSIAESVIVHNCDIDEFLEVNFDVSKYTIINTKGYDIVGGPESRSGVFNPMSSKHIMFRPSKFEQIGYTAGCHRCTPKTRELQGSRETAKLLHRKFISEEYVFNRHKMYEQRLSDVNKQYGWGVHYQDVTLEKINEQFKELRKKAIII